MSRSVTALGTRINQVVPSSKNKGRNVNTLGPSIVHRGYREIVREIMSEVREVGEA